MLSSFTRLKQSQHIQHLPVHVVSQDLGVQVKAFVPVWAKSPLGDGGSLRLLAIDRSNGEGIREAFE